MARNLQMRAPAARWSPWAGAAGPPGVPVSAVLLEGAAKRGSQMRQSGKPVAALGGAPRAPGDHRAGGFGPTACTGTWRAGQADMEDRSNGTRPRLPPRTA